MQKLPKSNICNSIIYNNTDTNNTIITRIIHKFIHMKTIRNLFALIAAFALGALSVIDEQADANTLFYWVFALSLILVFIFTIINFYDEQTK